MSPPGRVLEDMEDKTPQPLWGGRESCQAGAWSWGRRSVWHQEVMVEERDAGDA